MGTFYRTLEVNILCVLKFPFSNQFLNSMPLTNFYCRCSVRWEHSLTSGLLRNRLQIQIQSDELLNINITSTLLELYSMVKDNWTQDYCSPHRATQGNEEAQKSMGGPVGLRRRSPFVPFALKNDTGSVLWFTVLVKTSEKCV